MMSDNDRLVRDYEEGLITSADLKSAITDDNEIVVLSTIIKNVLRGNNGVLESLEMFNIISEILDIASDVKTSVSVFTSVVCEGSEDLIRYTINEYLSNYGYFDRNKYDDLLLDTEEAVIPFLEAASDCMARFSTVYHVVFNDGVLGLRVHQLLGYYLLRYNEIDWDVARSLYDSVNDYELILRGISNWGLIEGNPMLNRAMSRLHALSGREDV